jgi:hypothetical protein
MVRHFLRKTAARRTRCHQKKGGPGRSCPGPSRFRAAERVPHTHRRARPRRDQTTAPRGSAGRQRRLSPRRRARRDSGQAVVLRQTRCGRPDDGRAAIDPWFPRGRPSSMPRRPGAVHPSSSGRGRVARRRIRCDGLHAASPRQRISTHVAVLTTRRSTRVRPVAPSTRTAYCDPSAPRK